MSRPGQKRNLAYYLYTLILLHVTFFAYSIYDGNANLVVGATATGFALSIVGLPLSMFVEKSIKKKIIVSCNLVSLAAYVSFAYYLFYIALPRALDGIS